MARILDTKQFDNVVCHDLPARIFKTAWLHGAQVSERGVHLRTKDLARKIAENVNADLAGRMSITAEDLWDASRWEE